MRLSHDKMTPTHVTVGVTVDLRPLIRFLKWREARKTPPVDLAARESGTTARGGP